LLVSVRLSQTDCKYQIGKICRCRLRSSVACALGGLCSALDLCGEHPQPLSGPDIAAFPSRVFELFKNEFQQWLVERQC